MHAISTSDKVKTLAWLFATRSLVVVAVLLVGLIPGISTLVALIIVLSLTLLWTAVGLLLPAQRRRNQSPGGLAGDRSPLRPQPFNPAGAVSLSTETVERPRYR